MRWEKKEKELEECTFEPRTNHKNVPASVKFNWFCKNENTEADQFAVISRSPTSRVSKNSS